MRGRHTRAIVGAVRGVTSRRTRENVDPGGSQIDACGTVVREVGKLIATVESSNGNDIVHGVAGGVAWGCIVVIALVPRRRDKKNASRLRSMNGRGHGQTVTTAAPTVAENIDALANRVVNTGDCI